MKKKAPIYVTVLVSVITLVIGALAGFFICSKGSDEHHFADKDNLSKSDKQQIAKTVYKDSSFGFITKTISHPVSATMAYKLISEFQTQNNNSDFPITNYAHIPLKSYYIDKDPFLSIFKEDPTYTGITFYFAEDSTAYARRGNGLAPKRVFTLIYMGAKEKLVPNQNGGVDTTYDNHTINNKISTPYDFIKPCPDFCSNFEATPPPANVANKTNNSKKKKN